MLQVLLEGTFLKKRMASRPGPFPSDADVLKPFEFRSLAAPRHMQVPILLADRIKRLQRPGNTFAAVKFTGIKDMDSLIKGSFFTKKDALIISAADNTNSV